MGSGKIRSSAQWCRSNHAALVCIHNQYGDHHSVNTFHQVDCHIGRLRYIKKCAGYTRLHLLYDADLWCPETSSTLSSNRNRSKYLSYKLTSKRWRFYVRTYVMYFLLHISRYNTSTRVGHTECKCKFLSLEFRM